MQRDIRVCSTHHSKKVLTDRLVNLVAVCRSWIEYLEFVGATHFPIHTSLYTQHTDIQCRMGHYELTARIS